MGFFLIVHLIVCLLLIIVVLIQVGRGASTGASFGGGVRTFFGPTGATTFLGKVIIVLAIIFVFTTFCLFLLSRGGKPPKLEPEKKSSARVEAVFQDRLCT